VQPAGPVALDDEPPEPARHLAARGFGGDSEVTLGTVGRQPLPDRAPFTHAAGIPAAHHESRLPAASALTRALM
jgi:hypothetical protein